MKNIIERYKKQIMIALDVLQTLVGISCFTLTLLTAYSFSGFVTQLTGLIPTSLQQTSLSSSATIFLLCFPLLLIFGVASSAWIIINTRWAKVLFGRVAINK